MTRVEREMRNPDEAMRAALREVDQMLPGTPPIAPSEPAPPTLVGGNSVWRAQNAGQQAIAAWFAGQANAAQQGAAALNASNAQCTNMRGPLLFDKNLEVTPLRWFWPYVQADLGGDMFLLREQFGAGRVSRGWLEFNRHNIVQAIRARAGRDE